MNDKELKAEGCGCRRRGVAQPRGAEERIVTMLDYEGCPVVTYSVVDKHANPSRGAS